VADAEGFLEDVAVAAAAEEEDAAEAVVEEEDAGEEEDSGIDGVKNDQQRTVLLSFPRRLWRGAAARTFVSLHVQRRIHERR
jgi:hypothetical protein